VDLVNQVPASEYLKRKAGIVLSGSGKPREDGEQGRGGIC
jgi:hypothetical protein